MGEACACRCHVATGLPPGECCPECDAEAYEPCSACGEPQYAHNYDERPRHPGACERSYHPARDAKLRTEALEAAGQQRLFAEASGG